MRNSRSTCLIWRPLSGAGLCQGTICVGLPDVANKYNIWDIIIIYNYIIILIILILLYYNYYIIILL